MDDKHLKQLLTEIAQQEIDSEMNLWPEIQSKLGKPVSQPRHTALRLLRVAAAIALLVVTTAAAYAVYQELVPGDPGLSEMNDEITQFDQTQPIDTEIGRNLNLQVTLQYAYADANRITIAYSATGEARAGDAVQIFVNPTLTDSENRQYTWLPVGGGGGGGGGGSDPDELVSFGTNGLANFDASILEQVPETLDLNLKIEVAYTNAELRQENPSGMLFAGETVFSFTLPLARGRIMDTPLTVSAGGIEMTLQKVVVAPSMTRIEMCYPPLDDEHLWTPYGTLEIGSEVVFGREGFNMAGLGEYLLSPDDECRALIIPQALQELEGEWRLTIDSLRRESSVDVEVLAERLREDYSIEITILPDGGFSFSRDQALPEGVNLPDAVAQINEELAERVVGPWTFNFEVPQ